MPHRARLTVRHAHFAHKQEVLAEIAQDDLWPLTIDQEAFAPAPVHCHAAPVRIYVLSGELLVDDGGDQEPVRAAVGSRVDIPATAAHTVSAEAAVVTIVAFVTSAHAAGLPQLPVTEPRST